MASQRNKKWTEKDPEAEGTTALDFESMLAGKLAKEDTISDSPPTEEVEEKREQLRAVTDIPEQAEASEVVEGEVTDQVAEPIAQTTEADESLTPESFEDAMEMVNAVDVKDFKMLDGLAKRFSKLKYIIRMPVQGVGWTANPRKEGEGPITAEESKKLCDLFNARFKEMKPEKAKTAKTPEEQLADFLKIVEGIKDADKLFELTMMLKRGNFLFAGTTEKGYWVKPLKGSESSEKLVNAINEKKSELARAIKLEMRLNEIEKATNLDELEKVAYRFDDKLGILKKNNIGARGWEVTAIADVEDSQKIVDAIISKKKELSTLKRQLKAIDEVKSGSELELADYHYLVVKGRGKGFTAEAGRKFGGKKVAHAVMQKKEEFIGKSLSATLGDIAAKFA